MKYITIPTSNDYKVWYNENYYVDKSGELLKLEGTLERGSALFFARPRRWGKSLFFSMTNYFFNKELYKKEYFEGKKIEESEKLMKRAGTYFVISLDLKPIYDRDSNSLNWDLLWEKIYEQLPEIYLEEYFGFNKTKKEIEKEKQLKYFKRKSLGEFLKSFIERYSEQEEILLLIDEYDKPVNDCLKYKKRELECKNKVLEELKDKLYRYLKDIPCITMITGINKLSMASFFSDFNNLSDYSKKIILGFRQEEVLELFKRLEVYYNEDLKDWYNGYRVGKKILEYNPWAVNKYLESDEELEAYWSKTGTAPDYFRYLVKDILKVKDFEDYLELLKDYNYTDEVISLETISELNISVILHYFYYAGLLTITEERKFAIPNNDVIFAYRNLIFANTLTQTYVALRNKAIDGIEKLEENKEYLEEFIEYLLREKYVNQDKRDLGKLGEQVITSDIYLIYKTFVRLDLRREVNILEGRTDLEYIDYTGRKILYEFKVVRNINDLEKKKEEGIKQLERYGENYDRKYLIIVDLEKIDVLVERV